MEAPLAALVLLPLAGFLVNGLLGRRLGPRLVSVVGCGLPLLAFAAAVQALLRLEAGGAPLMEPLYIWAAFGTTELGVSLYLDRLAAVMALVVTGVGSLIHLYSVGYMQGDAGYARYFAYLNLFLFFMLLLVLGQSLLVLFVGWEGVGLASYLLIGFWFDDPAKAAAGMKAFITNRVGDAGFLLGMFVLYAALGTLDLAAVSAGAGDLAPATATLAAVLLFIGATGKSAQIPLHVWLPDAMAGPTPVSALIHAATMVTAGVYLVARLAGLYDQSPDAALLVAAVGTATAFFAATVALVQTDIKKVLAYSTISQLGFMFLAAGTGAYGVAVFHLVTHAFFKACLFLGAGSVIHALHGEQDMRRMGGLARRIPLTFVTFAVATAAIAGLPPLAGFYSKDEILWFAWAGPGGGPLLWAVAALTAFLTALYMFRLLWRVFLGAPRLTPETAADVHESPWSMTGVLVALATLSAVGGSIAVPHYLHGLLPLPAVAPETAGLHGPLAGVAVLVALAGVAAAVYAFRGEAAPAARAAARFAPAHRVLSRKYYVDELYERALHRPLLWLGERVFLGLGDRVVIDGSLHAVAALARGAGRGLMAVQSGSLRRYAWLVLAGLAFGLLWSWAGV